MFVVKNVGEYPVIIRDLNFHISGGKSVDLDLLFRKDTSDRSIDLKKLIEKGKLVIEGQKAVEKVILNSVVKNNEAVKNNDNLLLELKDGILKIQDILKLRGVSEKEPQVEYDEETLKQITNLQVKNLSDNSEKTEKNFDKLGTTTKREEGLNDLLNVLDLLEEKEK